MNIINKIKFAMLLSVASLMGLQASEAGEASYKISCPAAKSLHQSQVKNEFRIEGIAHYSVNKKPEELVFSLESFSKTADLETAEFLAMDALKGTAVCMYMLKTKPIALVADVKFCKGMKVVDNSIECQ